MNKNIRIVILCILFSTFFYASDKNFITSEIRGNSNIIRFNLNDLDIQEKEDFHKIGSDAKPKTIEAGKPELPVYSFSYGLNPEKEYNVEYKVIKSSIINDVNIYPHQPEQRDLNQGLIKDNNVYESPKPYPETNIAHTTVNMRGYEIMNIQILPFEYSPEMKKLVVHDEVEISITEIGDKKNQDFLSTHKRSRTFEQFYNNLVLHSDFQREGEYQQPSIIYICGDGVINSSGMELLVNWRKKQGYSVEVVEINQIGSSTTSIKNYIENAYDTWENPPEFVGLVGDSGGNISLPSWWVGSGGQWGGAYAESDYPYTLMDGSSDIIGDIFIGRLSVRSVSDMWTVANKIIGYEQAYAGLDWIENVALVGDPYDSGISTVISNQYIEQIMDNYGVQNIHTKYSGSGFDTFMRDQINNGISYLNYRGFYGFSNFNSNDVDALYNGYKLPFIVTLTCGTGSFQTETTSIIEDLFRAGSANNPKGGVAVVGTAQSYTHTAFNNIVSMGIFEGIFVQGAQTTGEALLYGKYAINNTYPQNPNNNAYYFSSWNNLMGDPATLLWTKRPGELIIDHHEVISSTVDNFIISVIDENGTPVSDANVNLYDSQLEIYKNGHTDQFGYASIPLAELSSDYDIDVTVSKQDYLFSSSSFIISSTPSELFIDLSSVSIIDYNSNNSISGNGDGMANPGESIALDFAINNLSDISFNDVIISLSSPSNLIDLSESSVLIEEITQNSQLNLGESLQITIPSSVSTFNEPYIFVEMSYLDANGDAITWIDNLLLNIFSGAVDISPVVTNDTNNNSILERGETAYLSFNLHNIGEIELNDVIGIISYNGALLNFTETEIYWNHLDVGNISLSGNDIQVSVGDNIINGTILNIPIEVTSGNDNYSSIIYFELQIGEVTVNDPFGPDSYGYYIYDESDTYYELTPEYDWIEIDPYYGGLGQEVDIFDGGNNGDESTVVELPFTFTFYGIDYDEITICSNGWISFGNTDLASFRNYPIPGPGGPSPMLAVFWDDLIMSTGGEIFTLYDQNTDSFIIEWSDMRTYNGNGLETFQAILINSNWESPTGDDDIKLQYKEFNNVSEGHYPVGNYDGSVIHGQYCSVGLENNDGTGGLEYTFNNNYPTQCMPLSDEKALFITTKGASLYAQPELQISHESLTYDLELNQSISQDIILENIGQEESILLYEIGISPFSDPQSYIDEFGYTWSESRVDEYINSEWIDISSNNVVLDYETNDDALLYDVGFDFPFYGEYYSSILINPNGWIGLDEDSNAWNNQPLFSNETPNNAIFGFWDDLCPITQQNPDGVGYVRVNSDQERIVIWYDSVRHWTSYERVYDFQIVLYSTGEIHFNYREMIGEVDSATIGIINFNGSIGHEVVYNSEFLDNNITIYFRQSPNWLSAINSNETSSGSIEHSNSEIIDVSINMINNPAGFYLSYLLIDTNTSYDPIIPIIVNVVDGILYGDLNSDGSVDVLDAVRMIHLIVDEETPTSYELLVGDLNQDMIIDVLDIVILINIIINE